MIHILFGMSPSGCLKIVLKNLGIDKEERVLSFWEMFSVGPIWRLHEEVGIEARFDWLKNSMNDEYEELDEYRQSFQETCNQIGAIPEAVPITIWTGENSHEQTGLRYVLHLLKEKDNDIFVINTTKMHGELFNTRELTYILLHTGEISPEKLQVIYEQSKNEPPLTQHEREELDKEWHTLSENRESLRIWRYGKVLSVPVDYYDQYIINVAKKLYRKRKSDDFMKSARLIGEALGHLDQYVGDVFLEYRLRKLIENGIFEVEGSMAAMRYYSVRLKRQ
ncbi:DUF1835 domain-containing protein [bacterium LRH843]|nr:DUF1835 domain-containing protein [bacterium LRH843]